MPKKSIQVPKGKSSASPPKAVPKAAKKSETEAPPLTTAEKAEAFIAAMNKDQKYKGRVQVRSAREYRTPFMLRRPTGLLGLDIALGGGFPAGGSSQLFGAKSSGKTHTCLCVAGQVQQHYGNNALICVGVSEYRFDVGFARKSGFCVAYSPEEIAEYDKIRVDNGFPAFTAEELADLQYQIGEVVVLGGNTGSDMLDSTIKAIEDFGSACQLMIIDSLGSLLTPDANEKSVGDKLYGGSSVLLTTWQNKVQPKFINDLVDAKGRRSLLETTILGINQVRALIGGPSPNMTRPAAGAKSWEHAQLVSVEFKKGEPLYTDSKHTDQSGHEVRWVIKKGKAGMHDGARGAFNWHYPPENNPVFWKDVEQYGSTYCADKITDLVETAKAVGLIELAGAWMTVKDENGGIIVKAQGVEQFAEKVVNDPELELILRDGCLRASNLTIRYR